MSAKMSGVEFNVFYADPAIWGKGDYHDDLRLLVDEEVFIGQLSDDEWRDGDVTGIMDNAVVEIECGVICASDPDGEQGMEERREFTDVVKRWLRKRDVVRIVLQVATNNKDTVERAIRAAGGEIVG